jgi:hypothetical protein
MARRTDKRREKSECKASTRLSFDGTVMPRFRERILAEKYAPETRQNLLWLEL